MIEEYYRDNKDRLTTTIGRSLGDYHAGEDIVHDAFVLALKYDDGFRKESEYGTWFHQLLRTAINKYLRAKNGMGNEDIERFPNIPEPNVKVVWENENRIEHLISEMKNKKHALALELFFIKGYNAEEVSDLTGLTNVAVWNVCSRFRKSLEGELEV